MKGLFDIYLREWIGLLFLSLLLALSSFWAAREYREFKENLLISHQLGQELQVAERVSERLEDYNRYPFWQQLSPPQKIALYEKLGLRPLAEVINKLSKLYVKHGFFFLDKFELKTCLDNKVKQRGRGSHCVPHLYVTGKKVYYGKI